MIVLDLRSHIHNKYIKSASQYYTPHWRPSVVLRGLLKETSVTAISNEEKRKCSSASNLDALQKFSAQISRLCSVSCVGWAVGDRERRSRVARRWCVGVCGKVRRVAVFFRAWSLPSSDVWRVLGLGGDTHPLHPARTPPEEHDDDGSDDQGDDDHDNNTSDKSS